MPIPTTFVLNGAPVVVDADVDSGESLLNVLRERLGIMSAKDGCAPQGQCGCCTVLVDGQPRVACVTPIARVEGRAVTTIEGLDEATRTRAATAFVADGGSQCGFCTPGIVMRFAGERARAVDRALAAHLCRCTGWLTVRDAIADGDAGAVASGSARDLEAAGRRAALETGGVQRVGLDVPIGGATFADDTAPRAALVAVPLPPGSAVEAVSAAGLQWVVAESLLEARARAAKVQGRRTTVVAAAPLLGRMPACPPDGVQLATQWVEPAYLEPDASWCEPGGEPASPLANGGAFGGKVHSAAPFAARELADHFGRAVRVVYAREDVVRLGPKRPPIAAVAVAHNGVVEIDGVIARGAGTPRVWPTPPGIEVRARWTEVDVPGPPVSADLRAVGLAEQAILVAGALGPDVGVEVVTPSGARATASVTVERDTVVGVAVTIAAGDPLDEVVLRSYAIGAAHMAIGWVTSEGLAVDPATGEIHDLTIRSFGVLRPADTPPITVTIVDDPAPPARSLDRRGVRRGRGCNLERARSTHYVSGVQEVTMAVESVPTPSAPKAAGPYSPAVRAGDWLVLAGQVGLDPASGAMVAGGVEAEARQVLANITAVLRDCGAALTDVAKTTVFVTDIAEFATVNAVYAEAFGDHRPARSTIQVAALPAAAQVEIEAWAYLPM